MNKKDGIVKLKQLGEGYHQADGETMIIICIFADLKTAAGMALVRDNLEQTAKKMGEKGIPRKGFHTHVVVNAHEKVISHIPASMLVLE